MELPRTPQELAVVVDDEQRRQDMHLAAIRALVGDSKSLRIVEDKADAEAGSKPGVLGNLRKRLRATRTKARSTEDLLRGRIEAALTESKRASMLVDRFAALREELFADVTRLNTVISRAQQLEAESAAAVVSASVAKDSAESAESASAHAANSDDTDNSRRHHARTEQRLDLAQRTAERLSVVVVSARGLIGVIDTLATDVAAFARAAERELDALSARARAVSLAEDAAAVVIELERSLLSLSSSLDDVTVFATAVHERVARSDDTKGLASALDTLVQAALARRAAAAAKEEAQQT